MADFLWHEVSEKEKQEIQKQAKTIMDDFSAELARVCKSVPETLIEREDFEREEGSEKIPEMSREIMFENALEKNKDFIIAEKKKW